MTLFVSDHALANFNRRVRPAGYEEVRLCLEGAGPASPRVRRLIWRCAHRRMWHTLAWVPKVEDHIRFRVHWGEGAAFMTTCRDEIELAITVYSFRELREVETSKHLGRMMP